MRDGNRAGESGKLFARTALGLVLAGVASHRVVAQTPASPQNLPAVTVEAPTERKKFAASRATTTRVAARSAKRKAERPPNAAPLAAEARSISAGASTGETATSPVTGYKANRSATATKTDTPIRDIPQSIQVVPRQVIDDQGATSVEDAVRNVSGVIHDFNAGGRSDSFSIRGFDNAQTATDGVLNNRTFGQIGSRDLVDVERVEVLKGPSSVLFGQNPPGGLINFVTKQPTATPFVSGEAFGGSYGYARGTLDVSAPFEKNSDFSYRLNVAYDRDDTFRHYFVPNERLTIVPTVQWKPSAQTTVTATVYTTNQNRQFDRGLVLDANDNPNGDRNRSRIANIPYSTYFGDSIDKTHISDTEARIRLDHAFNDSWSVRVITRAEKSYSTTLAGQTGTLNPDEITVDRGGFTANDGFVTLSAEADITGKFWTGDLKHTVFLGAEANDSVRKTNGLTNFDMTTVNVYAPIVSNLIFNRTAPSAFFSQVVETSGYAEDQVALPYGFKFVFGGRYDVDHQRNGGYGAAVVPQDSTALSPRVGLVWQPTDIVSLYGSYSTSFVPNVGLDVNGAGLAPTRAKQYEVGVKLDLLDKRLSTTLAAFDIAETNVATTDPTDANFQILTGRVRSRGIEFDTVGKLTEELRVISSFAYVDAFVAEDNVIPIGNQIPNIPRVAGSLWTTYENQTGPLKGLGIGAGLFAVGAREGDQLNTFKVSPYYRVDASAWYNLNAHTRLQLNIKNLTNTRYVDSTTDSNIQPGAPLIVTGSVRVTF